MNKQNNQRAELIAKGLIRPPVGRPENRKPVTPVRPEKLHRQFNPTVEQLAQLMRLTESKLKG